MSQNPPAGDPPPTPEADDAEAAAVWSRLAPHAKKSFTEALDEYFAEAAQGDDDAGSGGAGGSASAGGAGGDRAGADKKPAKAKTEGPDLGREISEFFFGKSRKT